MKTHIIIAIMVIVLASSYSTPSVTPRCDECTKSSPCSYQRPAGDGCNTCSGTTWCVNGKWFTDGIVNCTLASCVPINGYEIPNPFLQNIK